MNTFRKMLSFVKTLGRDTRGEDLTEKSSAVSNAAKGVGGAVAAVALIAGTVTALNNSNATSEKTQNDIAAANGAQVTSSEKVSNPFQGKK